MHTTVLLGTRKCDQSAWRMASNQRFLSSLDPEKPWEKSEGLALPRLKKRGTQQWSLNDIPKQKKNESSNEKHTQRSRISPAMPRTSFPGHNCANGLFQKASSFFNVIFSLLANWSSDQTLAKISSFGQRTSPRVNAMSYTGVNFSMSVRRGFNREGAFKGKSFYYPGQKKKNHHRDSRREESCSTCDIMLDQAQSAQGKSHGQSRIGFVLRWSRLIEPDRAWYHTWNSVLLATNLDDGSFFCPG